MKKNIFRMLITIRRPAERVRVVNFRRGGHRRPDTGHLASQSGGYARLFFPASLLPRVPKTAQAS